MTIWQWLIVAVVLIVIGLEVGWRFTDKLPWWAKARKIVWGILTGGLALLAFWLSGRKRQPTPDTNPSVPRHEFDDSESVELRKETENTNLDSNNARREANDAKDTLAGLDGRADARDDLLADIRNSTD